MKIQWAVPFRFIGGNAAGYTGSSLNLRKALTEIGVEVSDSSKVAIHYCHPADFFPIDGKINILFTMYESEPVPDIFARKFAKCHAIFTPTKFCKDLFDPLRGKTPLMVSKLGVDPELFPYKERSWDGSEPFRWLWIGAPNTRHGWPQVVSAWSHLFKDKPYTSITMKTSSETGEGELVTEGNLAWDSRMYTKEQMTDLYQSAHAFVHPLYGAGFSLPVAEALAVGLPTITTGYGGQVDFIDTTVGWICSHTFEMVPMSNGDKLKAACPDVADLGRKMIEIMSDYPAALERAKRGSDRIHGKWTWHHAARQIVKNLQRLGYDS